MPEFYMKDINYPNNRQLGGEWVAKSQLVNVTAYEEHGKHTYTIKKTDIIAWAQALKVKGEK